MRLLFDYQAFEFQRIGGVSRSYAELIPRLKGRDSDVVVGVKECNNVYLREKALVSGIKPLYYRHNLLFERKKLFKGQRTLTRKAAKLFGYENECWQVNKDYCIKLLKRQRFDIFEPTFYDSYFLSYLKDKPFVMTVHDMIPELFPQYYSREDFQITQKRLLCPLATHIHVPSQRTKEDLVSVLDIAPDKISVIPHGGPKPCSNEQLHIKLFEFPYLLYVGDRYGYKNFKPLLYGFAKVHENYKDVRLVCTGKSFDEAEKRLIADLHLEDQIIHYYADQESFGSLYHNAIAFVYPSAYEGFGIPILEAFTYGCPVMLNNASCFPEVGGDAALYFEMDENGADFFEKFQYLYTLGSEDRLRMIEKGKERLQNYSWDESARKLMAVYNSLT